jgi:hypothetical protein
MAAGRGTRRSLLMPRSLKVPSAELSDRRVRTCLTRSFFHLRLPGELTGSGCGSVPYGPVP